MSGRRDMDLDRTRGSSLLSAGSPLLNARAVLMGGNLDRAYEAMINDRAGSESYSRSIAVDICYVLWVTEKGRGAAHLLKKLGNNSQHFTPLMQGRRY